MYESDTIFKNHLFDLANKAYRDFCYTFTDFLTLDEINIYIQSKKELNFIDSDLFGGSDKSERLMVRFGSKESLGYDLDFPIQCIKIEPKLKKFSDELTHRDFLGSIMNAGVQRKLIGDIFIDDRTAYVFVVDTIADYLCENIIKVKHTAVVTEKVNSNNKLLTSESKEIFIQSSSSRIDSIISKVYNISRTACLELFRKQKIFLNGKICENNSQKLMNNDVISVRGYGKFIYLEVNNLTRKGKLNIKIELKV